MNKILFELLKMVIILISVWSVYSVVSNKKYSKQFKILVSSLAILLLSFVITGRLSLAGHPDSLIVPMKEVASQSMSKVIVVVTLIRTSWILNMSVVIMIITAIFFITITKNISKTIKILSVFSLAILLSLIQTSIAYWSTGGLITSCTVAIFLMTIILTWTIYGILIAKKISNKTKIILIILTLILSDVIITMSLVNGFGQAMDLISKGFFDVSQGPRFTSMQGVIAVPATIVAYNIAKNKGVRKSQALMWSLTTLIVLKTIYALLLFAN